MAAVAAADIVIETPARAPAGRATVAARLAGVVAGDAEVTAHGLVLERGGLRPPRGDIPGVQLAIIGIARALVTRHMARLGRQGEESSGLGSMGPGGKLRVSA